MSDRPVIKLVLFDADDTIWHAYKPWTGIEPALTRVIETTGADPEKLRHIIQHDAPGQYRFNDYGSLIHFLRKSENLFCEMDENKNSTLRAIRDDFWNEWREQTRYYDGTINAIRHIRAQSTATAILTDSDAPAVPRRNYFCALNENINPMESLGLFDAYYVMPSIECDSHLLWDVPKNYRLAAKERMILGSDPKGWKPNPARALAILEDFGVAPENALMIGDSYKDVITGLQAGMHAAWFKKGADHDERTVSLLTRYASPRFKYGLSVVKAELDNFTSEENYVTIHESLAELADHFTFAPAPRGYHHSLSSRQCHIPLALAHPDQLGSRSRTELNAEFGIATHFGAVIPVIEPQAPIGMAGPKTQGPQVGPIPALG